MTTTATRNLRPVVAGPEEDRAPFPIDLGLSRFSVKVTGVDSGGNFVMGHLHAEPMSGPPLHVHSREDEWFYILKGEMTFQVGDQRIVAGPGTSVFAPRNVPHTWQNLTSETVEAIGMVTPSAFEGFLAELAKRKPVDEATMIELTAQYGNRIIGPPITR
jgi:quercetin dioxygenase-like cupin family protein